MTGLPTWTYNPDGEGRVSTVTASSGQNPVPATNPTSYNVFGQPTGVTFGSGDSDAFQFDPNTGRMTQYQATIGAPPSQSVTGALTWNANGSLRQLAITDPFNSANTQTCAYIHDDLARLGQVDCGANKFGQAYSYQNDNFGNITWSHLSGHSGSDFTPSGGYSTSTNHFASLGSYDANGNLTSDGAHNYVWDADGNLYQLADSLVTMTYDALGRRVEEAVGLIYTQILYGPGGSKLALIGGLTQSVDAAFLPLPGGATAVYNAAGLSRYRHADWLGSSRLSSTTSQAVSYDGAYSPMGESYAEYGSADPNFTGQEQDGDLYAFPYRNYHPAHGRWISPDPAGVAAVNPANPQSWNRYAYVNGSPLNLVDPSGLNSIPMCQNRDACREAVLYLRENAESSVYNAALFWGTMTLWRPDTGYSPSAPGTSAVYFCDECTFKVWGYGDMPDEEALPDIRPPDFYSFSFEAGPLAYSFSWVPSTRNGYYSTGGGTGSGASLTAGWMVRGTPNGFLAGPSGNFCGFYGVGVCAGTSLSGETALQGGLGLGGWGASAGSGIDPVQILKDMLFSHPVDGAMTTKVDAVYMDDETPSWLQMVP